MSSSTFVEPTTTTTTTVERTSKFTVSAKAAISAAVVLAVVVAVCGMVVFSTKPAEDGVYTHTNLDECSRMKAMMMNGEHWSRQTVCNNGDYKAANCVDMDMDCMWLNQMGCGKTREMFETELMTNQEICLSALFQKWGCTDSDSQCEEYRTAILGDGDVNPDE
eukprot:GFYU01000237.1.p1 GENE.GFYU01000237.1~~GFYU01000237.1.p1  ORF type:complete len:164 (+),score=67.09 GFYU01000237.1:52-543(+)